MHANFGRGELLFLAQEFRGPLIAFGVALVLAVAGRVMRWPLAAAAAGGLGVAAGWYSMSLAPFSLEPRLLADRLFVIGLGITVVSLVAGRIAGSRAVVLALLVSALGCGWWLAGGPRSRADFLFVWPVALSLAAAVIVTWLLIRRGMEGPFGTALAGCALAACLHIAGAPWVWVLLALVPGLASLGAVAAPRLAGLGVLPLAADAAAAAGAAVLAAGRLTRGHVGPVDVAALAPLAALWLAPRATRALRGFGQAAPVLGAIIGFAVALAIAWMARRWLR
jgi:hypothetical protein